MESGTQLKTQLLIPVLVTGIQPDQVLGLKELFPRRRRGAAFIPVTSTRMRTERLQFSDNFPTAPRVLCCMFSSFDRLRTRKHAEKTGQSFHVVSRRLA
ncbi:hypothetical protein CN070_08495 [Sinorhizobium meliloti]|nr:hypothetical protein CN070_08495 [Sinorhizobium meliloti]